MRNKQQMTLWLLLSGCCLALSFPAHAQTVDKRKAEITTTQALEFDAKGTIQIVDSFGSVKVEGWDKEEVELTVTKRTQKTYGQKDLAKAMKGLERFKVTMEPVGETSMMVINTAYPSWTPARMFRGKTNLELNYLIKVPRQSALLIKHGIGEVQVADVAGDIEATASIGEITLNLPEGQHYAVDARVRIGDVSSEFGQDTQRQGLFAVGAKLAGEPAAPTRRIFARMGIGDIQVTRLRAEKSGEQDEKKAAQSGPQEKEVKAPALQNEFRGEGQQREQAPAIHTYKTVGGESLTLHVFSPPGNGKKRSAVVLFHGGGWVWGSPEITYDSARDYMAGGAVAFAAQYRLANRGAVTPVEQVEDARDAIRWVRKNAEKFGIDPKRVIAHGVSAGGHLATMAAVSSDSTAWPDALVLWSPGLGVTSSSYFKGLLGDRARESDMSPYEQARQGMPPMIIISGVEDAVTPDAEARRYCERVSQKGGRCDIRSYERLGHLLSRKLDPKAQLRGDFDWDHKATSDAQEKILSFLRSLGYLDF
ncbi:MAG TPA: alpha/beta hydrolase [Blastocatellia bacterium]|nr:alpha/beta hydrolase [Blastocatellia bacterium]